MKAWKNDYKYFLTSETTEIEALKMDEKFKE